MQNAVFLSSIFGPLLFFIGLWMVTYTKNLSKIIGGVKNPAGALWFMGFIKLLIGLTILNVYSIWVWNMTLPVTILGWVLTIRGLTMFFMPKLFNMFTVKKESVLKALGFIPLVWGIILSWFAFFM